MTIRQTAPPTTPQSACTVSTLARVTGWLLLLAMVISWSSGFIGYRYAAEQGGVFLATFWRFVLAALVLLPFAMKQWRQLRRGDVVRQALIGVFAIAGYIGPIARSIELGVAPGTSAVLANLLPVTIVLLAGFVPGQQTRGWQWLGLLLCVAGMLIASASSIELGTASVWAFALPLFAVLSLACATLYQKRAPVARMSALTALFIQVCATIPVFAGLALYEGGLQPVATTGFAFGVVWLVVFGTLGGYGFYWLNLQRFSMQHISGALFLTPPVTMVWAWLQFGDDLPGIALIGVLLTLIGLPLLSRRT
ncbi:DMT family transporter [Xanthomonas sp. WHRI 1810A]|uniref:DMT family transporter n=1 Tax=Xanthomonas sp. WHRI 1810A TaxID=3161565 RepID=UPI0032E8AC97